MGVWSCGLTVLDRLKRSKRTGLYTFLSYSFGAYNAMRVRYKVRDARSCGPHVFTSVDIAACYSQL